jgi:hypothetical protein
MATETHAIENAQAWLENIAAMVKRLEHAEECNDLYCMAIKDVETAKIYGAAHYHDADAAREAIEESPLSIEVRSDWHTLHESFNGEPSEYRILLTTGGPACRIIGELDQYGEPETARLEYQDWGTPWTQFSLFSVIHNDTLNELKRLESALLTYARQFYYGS